MPSDEARLVKISIDGEAYEVREGAYLLDVCRAFDVAVPTLCHHEALEPAGSCRLCVVEINKARWDDWWTELVTSCNYPAEDGLKVFTRSEKVVKARRTVLDLLLARCPKTPLIQELAKEYGLTRSSFAPRKDPDDCILCGLCVRGCHDLVGARAIGFVGRGPARRVAPPFEDESERCIGCGTCATLCPTGHAHVEDPEGRAVVFSDLVLANDRAMHTLTRQAVPNAPVVDEASCIYVRTGGCRLCEKVCPKEAVDLDAPETASEVEAGALIVATGFQTFDPARMPEYGYGTLPNVITALEAERMSNPSSPTQGKIVKADGKAPETVAILHCVGSRDENTHEYCSRVCCMFSIKFAHLIRAKTQANVYNFYMDVRAFGKGYEEFYKRVQDEGVRFVRGRPVEVRRGDSDDEDEKGKLVVRAENTLLGEVLRVPVDMVILGIGLEARADAAAVARQFHISQSPDGFFLERHPKLGPVETLTDGVFLAGAAQAPRDIPDTVAHAAAAGQQALTLISRGYVELEPSVSAVDPDMCAGCGMCVRVCAFQALELDEATRRAVVNEVLCKGCGLCAATCPSGAADQRHFRSRQLDQELDALLHLRGTETS